MLSLSQTTGYAILALSCLEQEGGRLMLAREIAERTSIPKPYLSKILHALGQAGLIVSKRGYRGGVALSRSPASITLMEVAEAVVGHEWRPRCLLGLAECSDERACPMHEFWRAHREQIQEQLRNVTLSQVAAFERDRQRAPRTSEEPTAFPGEAPGGEPWPNATSGQLRNAAVVQQPRDAASDEQQGSSAD